MATRTGGPSTRPEAIQTTSFIAPPKPEYQLDYIQETRVALGGVDAPGGRVQWRRFLLDAKIQSSVNPFAPTDLEHLEYRSSPSVVE